MLGRHGKVIASVFGRQKEQLRRAQSASRLVTPFCTRGNKRIFFF